MEQIALLQAWTDGLPKHCMQVGLKWSRESSSSPVAEYCEFTPRLHVSRTSALRGSYKQPRLTFIFSVELHTLSDYADLISQVCNSDGSQALPPSLEILANAASGGQTLRSNHEKQP
jgi:hypothetical protein